VAVIPEADFITADGVRLEGAGVETHVRSSPNDVFLAVAERIVRVAPFAGRVLRAGSLEGLQRPAEAEPVYREALRMAGRQSPAPKVEWRAVLHKRLAIILTARGDSAGARREYEEVLRLTPNDAEARAAVRTPRGPPLTRTEGKAP
jgi:Flp pilus assembly protein TadD